MQTEDFFTHYLKYTSDSEVPTFFNRWSAIAGIGAYLGRSFYFNHGHFSIYPNTYCMLIGNPGTRKSTAIKVMKKILKLAGYDTIAANKTSKEKFMMDLAEGFHANGSDSMDTLDTVLDQNLWGAELQNSSPAECFIMADEFNNFMGQGNLEFISLLTELWDFEGTFKNKIKTGKSISISDPTISILGGNTPTGFSSAFPTEILGQGFFSRLLLIYGEPNGRRITFPSAPDGNETEEIVTALQRIKIACIGNVTVQPLAYKLLDKVYKKISPVEDMRFESYYSRRFNHLIKLTLIIAAARLSLTVTERDVIYANTILTHTEHLMPKALGEFGKARHSDVSHKIVSLLENATDIVGFRDIWYHCRSDLDKMGDLSELLRNLMAADKVQQINGGFLPKKKPFIEVDTDTLDYSYLTQEEKDIRK